MLSACDGADDADPLNPSGKSDVTNAPARATAVSPPCDAAPAAVAASAVNTNAAASARVDRRSPEPITAMYGLDARILDHLGLGRVTTHPCPLGARRGGRGGGIPSARTGAVGSTGGHRAAGRAARWIDRAARARACALLPRAP